MAAPQPNFSEISSLHSRERQLAGNGSLAEEDRNHHFGRIIEEIDQLSSPDHTKESMVSESAKSEEEGSGDGEDGDGEPSLAMDDKDARRLLIVNYIRKRMEEIAARKMKSGFDGYKEMLELFETAKTVLLGLMIVFILFSRPEWCTAMGNSINYSCVDVLDPVRQVHIVKSWIPVLSSSTKYIICTLSMVTISILDSCKVGFSVSNREERSSTIVGMTLTLGYLFFTAMSITGLYSFAAMDLFPVFFLLTSLKLFRKSMLLFIEIITRAKFVFLYAIIFIVASSSVFFILFFGMEGLRDVSTGYYTYSFNGYHESFLTGVWALLGDKINIPGIMAYFLDTSFGYLALFILVSFFSKFFVQSYIVGVTYYFFSRYFKENVLDLRAKHPELEAKLTEMVEEDKLTIPELNQALDEYLTPPAEKDSIIEIEKFYNKATEKAAISGFSDNPDSGFAKLTGLIRHPASLYVLTGMEFLIVALLIVTVEADQRHAFGIYIVFFLVNFLTILRQVIQLNSNKFKSSSVLSLLEVTACVVINALIVVTMLSGTSAVFGQILDLNPSIKKIIGVLMAVKTLNFFKLLLRFDQIRMTILMLFRCFAFIMDILVTIFIIIFIFASIGIVLFGGQVNDLSGEKYAQVYGDFNPSYLILNFNDYYYAFLTLFTISFKGVIVVLRLNTVEKGEYGVVPLLFFIAYLFLINTCLLNMLFGFLIDNIAEYLKDHRMGFTEEKYAEINKTRRGGDDTDGGDDDDKGDGEAQKSQLVPDVSHFSEDLDVYLDLKKKQEKEKEESRLEPLLEAPVEDEEKEAEEGQVPAMATPALEQAPEPEPIVSNMAEVQSQAPSEEPVFKGTPVNVGPRAKFNPLSGLVKK